MSDFKKARNISLFLITIAYTYAIYRYHIVRGVAWEHFALYINNKAIALSSVFLIALSYIPGPLSRLFGKPWVNLLGARKYFGIFGFTLAAIHACVSLLIFNSNYYARFFAQDGKLTLEGELSMLFGVLAFALFSLVTVSSIPSVARDLGQNSWKKIQRSGYWAFGLVMLHVLVMGWGGWLKPNDWPGRLLPISLISFSVIAATLLMRIIVLFFPRSPK